MKKYFYFLIKRKAKMTTIAVVRLIQLLNPTKFTHLGFLLCPSLENVALMCIITLQLHHYCCQQSPSLSTEPEMSHGFNPLPVPEQNSLRLYPGGAPSPISQSHLLWSSWPKAVTWEHSGGALPLRLYCVAGAPGPLHPSATTPDKWPCAQPLRNPSN